MEKMVPLTECNCKPIWFYDELEQSGIVSEPLSGG